MKFRDHLLLIDSSNAETQAIPELPLIESVKDVTFEQLRGFLRGMVWPKTLSIAVLLSDTRLGGALFSPKSTDARACNSISGTVYQSADTLLNWVRSHDELVIFHDTGYERLAAVKPQLATTVNHRQLVGNLESRLDQLKTFLHSLDTTPRRTVRLPRQDEPLYFLPDWEDVLDADYDFANDAFSAPTRGERREVHCVAAMRPHRVCDGVLVSLAQHLSANGKGLLRSYGPTHLRSLAPPALREYFGLSDDQWMFGDCGAFSYAGLNEPPIKTDLALSLYHLYGFDFGASVDHIPLAFVSLGGGKRELSTYERRRRVRLTKTNAADFIRKHRQRGYSFNPVGVIQALSPRSFRFQLHEYVEMGYQHIGLGGLVLLRDHDIIEIVRQVSKVRQELDLDLWIHLFGVYRPRIQPELRKLGISSFDSATYFRKAWLRSGQNYLSPSGSWYSAIRVPVLNDPRTRKRLEGSNLGLGTLEQLEQRALKALIDYGEYRESLESALESVLTYDSLLQRDSIDQRVRAAYERTLRDRPWESCSCPICGELGVHALIFRGYNRNKRRGIHNTKMLYTAQ